MKTPFVPGRLAAGPLLCSACRILPTTGSSIANAHAPRLAKIAGNMPQREQPMQSVESARIARPHHYSMDKGRRASDETTLIYPPQLMLCDIVIQ